MESANPPHPSPRNQWVVSYTQSDVETIREQIVQNESAKRRWLVLALLVAVAAAIGLGVAMSSAYALYSSSQAEKQRLRDENATLKTAGDQGRQQLKDATAAQEREEQARNEAQSRLGTLLPAVLRSSASDSETSAFARMVYNLPHAQVEVDQKPPDKLFRNWRYKTDSDTETYTLVGGFIGGKWVIHSNLVARK
jgi:hypothetical protein